MILYRTVRSIRYLLFSRHGKGHGIHSPFIFDLVTRVFRNKTGKDVVNRIESIRKRMKRDPSRLEVNDLGRGPDRKANTRRRVSEIASRSPVPLKYGKLLAGMASEFGRYGIIELGTSLGISTMYLASGCPEARVDTVEGCGETAGVAEENFREAGFGNIVVHRGSFDDVLPSLVSSGNRPGLVFIDGDHRRESLLRYFETIAENADDKTTLIIDDINYSPEMGEAWNEIKQSGLISVTIDLCRMGIVFFRKGIARSDYVIRY